MIIALRQIEPIYEENCKLLNEKRRFDGLIPPRHYNAAKQGPFAGMPQHIPSRGMYAESRTLKRSPIMSSCYTDTREDPDSRSNGATLVVHEDLTQEILDGLRRRPRTLPCKLFYDDVGSHLFDRICEQPEYYPTRTELHILDVHGEQMGRFIGEGACIVEPGAGSVVKIRKLLDYLWSPACFVPIDISSDHLTASVRELNRRYPDLNVQPIEADYMADDTIEASLPDNGRRVVFFPGSTIGNFTREEAAAFLARLARWVGAGGKLIIGVDLRKDPALLHAAYNDAAGVTAAFNLNILNVVNRLCDADFDPSLFAHEAIFNDQESRIEIRLISRRTQVVHVAGQRITLARGEPILTEYSHKYTVESFRQLAARAGFVSRHVWCDARQLFSVHGLQVR